MFTTRNVVQTVQAEKQSSKFGNIFPNLAKNRLAPPRAARATNAAEALSVVISPHTQRFHDVGRWPNGNVGYLVAKKGHFVDSGPSGGPPGGLLLFRELNVQLLLFTDLTVVLLLLLTL